MKLNKKLQLQLRIKNKKSHPLVGTKTGRVSITVVNSQKAHGSSTAEETEELHLSTAGAAAVADKFGEVYSQCKERIKALNAQADTAANTIKILADSAGVNIRKSKLVTGKKYVVGYSTVAPRKAVDLDLLLSKVKDARKLEGLIVSTESVDLDVLEDLVIAGDISKKVFLACVKDSGSPITRVYVETKQNHEAKMKKYEDTSEEGSE